MPKDWQIELQLFADLNADQKPDAVLSADEEVSALHMRPRLLRYTLRLRRLYIEDVDNEQYSTRALPWLPDYAQF